ncbi:MAG: hypothetical protein IJ548_06965 [Paludibacteraceae bacterium]|nr:hypothetical protein [Paludibacteraceae bacterium]
MRKKTKNRHRGFGLQVLVAVLMLLVGGGNSCVGAIVHYRRDGPRLWYQRT